MFQSISWQEYFLGALLWMGAYYVISSLVLYSDEIKSIIKNGFRRPPENRDAVAVPIQLMDATQKTQPKYTSTEEEDLMLVAPENSLLLGSVADLGEEIKLLSRKLSGLSKEEVTAHFKSLLNKYMNLASTGYRSTINLLITETLKENNPERFSNEEINQWWE